MHSRQLQIPLNGDTRFEPLAPGLARELTTLRALRLPSMQRIDSQVSHLRLELHSLQQRLNQELDEWRNEGYPRHDTERDTRLRNINTSMRQVQDEIQDLEHAREQRRRLAYLEQL